MHDAGAAIFRGIYSTSQRFREAICNVAPADLGLDTRRRLVRAKHPPLARELFKQNGRERSSPPSSAIALVREKSSMDSPTPHTAYTSAARPMKYQPFTSRGVVGEVSSPSYLVSGTSSSVAIIASSESC
ncbi:hypothetical protein Tdes44962_MAKER03163 [Teratosphaeria destructans]|uniref:Uncharacterized protein n=1 Tax=Teratosphaeria destructans TaxID=418781 RepID=A0A9W7SRD6_9PEZI|nr:hypothetical protein Tdes44962_MAKER03163 [Teratosphaeria destructans]